jgi:hypothetical protein
MFRLSIRINAAVALVLTATTLLVSSTGAKAYPYHISQMTLQQQRRMELIRSGAKPSYQWRNYGKVRHLITFPTKIQHVVVIDMENRTVDNLFSAYYGLPFNGTTWDQVMNIADPNGTPTLLQNGLEIPFDPIHHHANFLAEELVPPFGCNSFDSPCETFSCPKSTGCIYPPKGPVTGYSFVPANETSEYAHFIENYASADEMLQANQGPSMPSHQYLISGQSGGFDAAYAPFAIADNPGLENLQYGNDFGQYPEEGPDTTYCSNQNDVLAGALDMTRPFPENVDEFNPPVPPCENYGKGTILDEVYAGQGNPPDYAWQYIGMQPGGYWSAPTAVSNLYNQYNQNRQDPTQPFAVDPNAYNFVQNITTGSGDPTRPFAALTYITPCNNESDHADVSGNDRYGPEWVGTVVNAIGESKYWGSTVIIVTWDDWGGWYDHMKWVESMYNPYPNLGGPAPNPADPNEWGARVPLIMISPYVISTGFVDHGPAGGTFANPVPRSQSAILNLVEYLLGVGTLSADDLANQHFYQNHYVIDDMSEMLSFKGFMPFLPASVPLSYHLPKGCTIPGP